MSIERCRDELTRAELAIERRDVWLTEAGETERALRLQLTEASAEIARLADLLQRAEETIARLDEQEADPPF